MNGGILLDIDMDYFVKPVQKNAVNGVRLYKDEHCEIQNVEHMFNNLKAKIDIPDEKHIFTNHKKSYIYWWMKRMKDCTIVHIDAHSDLYRNKREDLRYLNDVDMNCDDYLWYALREGFADEIYWVCPLEVMESTSEESICKAFGPDISKSVNYARGMFNIDFKIVDRYGRIRNIKYHILNADAMPGFKCKTLMMTFATSPEFIPSSADRLIDEINSILKFNDENIASVKKQHQNMLEVSREELERAKMLLNTGK